MKCLGLGEKKKELKLLSPEIIQVICKRKGDSYNLSNSVS